MNIQIIEHNSVPEYAIVPFGEWETIIDRLEEIEDIRDARTISAAIAAGEETYPQEFVKRLSSDESPLKVWREYRKFTLAMLAKACGCQSRPCPRAKTVSAPPAWIYWLSSPKRSAVTWKTLSGKKGPPHINLYLILESYLCILEQSFTIFRLGSFSRNLRNHNQQIFPNTYFWRSHQKQEIDYLEELNGELRGYEIKWHENRLKVPVAFSAAYPDCPPAWSIVRT